MDQPGDPFEREAEAVADVVMQSTEPPPPPGGSRSASGERAEAAALDEAEEEPVTGDESVSTAPLLAELDFSDEPIIVHRAPVDAGEGDCAPDSRSDGKGRPPSGASHAPSLDVAAAVSVALRAGEGEPLDTAARAFVEPRFGIDFSAVRVHTGPEAAESARALGAHAYTIGRHLVFGAGRYSPASHEGRRLLAHELAHVVQQASVVARPHAVEMVPGFLDQHRAKVSLLRRRPAVQREKIDHRQLAWDDFQSKNVPKGGKYQASTASGYHEPALAGVIPKDLVATDTGEECVLAKTKKGNVLGTTFRVEIALDPEAINVKPYMWQEKSWKRAWTTDAKAAGEKCEKEAVKACKKEYAKAKKAAVKDVGKQCKELAAECRAAFTDPDTDTWTLPVGDKELLAHNKKECSTVILPGCKKHTPLELGDFDYTMAGVTITATGPEKCGKEFKQDCVDQLIPAASAALLAHEQGHFDITKARADQAQQALRDLAAGFDTEVTVCAKGATAKQQKAGKAKAVAKAKALLKKELKQLQKEYQKQRKKLSATQKQYDKETQHGTIEEQQQTWLETIAGGLE